MLLLLLALLIVAALQWNSPGESVPADSRSPRRPQSGIVTLLKRLQPVLCLDRAFSSVIETLQLPPPKLRGFSLTREYALQPVTRSLTGHRFFTAGRVFRKRPLSD